MRLLKPETSSPMAGLGQPLVTLRQLSLHVIMKYQIPRPFSATASSIAIPAKVKLARGAGP